MSTDILNQLLAISDLLRRDMARAFDGTPLTESRAAVLWTLQTQGPSTQREVAAALEISAKHVSTLVDALEQSGYVTRSPHPSDRRAVLLELTEGAATTMAAMEREHRELTATLVDAVEPGDLPAVERALAAVHERLRTLTEAEETAT
ncbi:MarR family transcriptional regulator [Agrococcus sp. ARC_14]|uniref:MarR family winged helix-turn-helix transcriptional regulator n=1 Tax=Agrococcus sp. ARC_14 TaxID=2919927 RepID=UPI001F051AEB|nr:MarR family transcriptional regulator [Agrococcus sp. ARC_14]MCH1882143.1 MarR family transcriptional regulator [Agrococcus sp. ARC_14]